MKAKKQMIKRLTVISGIVLSIEIFFGQFISQMTFVYGALTIINRIIVYLSFTGFLFCLLILFKVEKGITTIAGFLLLGFWVINSISEIHPIDTPTEPIDIAILTINKDGKKTVIRQYTNAKTNEVIRDTVVVKDFFIFGYIY